MRALIVALVAGLVFGIGLSVSHMIDPGRVLGFLDVTGAWDATLVCVFAGALAVALPGFWWIRSRAGAVAGRTLPRAGRSDVDRRMIAGSVLFGIGWGTAGFCPGPAVATLAYGTGQSVTFVLAMLLGMIVFKLASGWIGGRSDPDPAAVVTERGHI